MMHRILTNLLRAVAALALLTACRETPQPANESASSATEARSRQEVLFEDGNYAMFIHFGLYSHLEGEWQGRTYRGNAEWIMYPLQAGIPVKEYMALAGDFNPSEFDADEVARLAKDAGIELED